MNREGKDWRRVMAHTVVSLSLVGVLFGCSLVDPDTQSPTASVNRVAPTAQPNSTRPNIVVLFADDLGYGDLSSYGHPNIATPNLDALAAGGQRWTNFYSPAPVCSPSRGALLTGRLPNRTGLFGKRINVMFPDDPNGMPASELTLAEALGDAGYATAILGKWHLGDDPAAYPTRHGFDYWFGLPYSNDMDWVGTFTFSDRLTALTSGKGLTEAQEAESAARINKYVDPKIDYWNVPLIRSERNSQAGVPSYQDQIVERPAQQPTLTDRYTTEALGFIDRTRAATQTSGEAQPFFVYLPYTMPHTPLFASTHFQEKSRGGVYGDVVEEIDSSVGRIVAGLAERGLSRDTLVVFTSDNGPWLAMLQRGGSAGLLRSGKGTTFEGGMRVPAIFAQPGTVAPGVVHDIGSGLDLFPTVLKMAGVHVPGVHLDGVDLTPALTGQGSSGRNDIAYYRQGNLMAWRHGDWKLHLIIQGAYGEGPELETLVEPALYHLGEDPAERFDVAKAHPDVVASIRGRIAAHQSAMVEQPPLFDQRLGH